MRQAWCQPLACPESMINIFVCSLTTFAPGLSWYGDAGSIQSQQE
jgi:hypothetical protein